MQYFNHRITTVSLISGARLVHVRVPNTPVSATSIWFRAGSRLDPAGKEGLAHFFEHLLMAKTKRFPDRVERLRFLESHGMYYNAFTMKETAHYYTVQLPDQTKNAIEVLCDGFKDTIIAEEDIARECEVISNEQSEAKGDPDRNMWNAANDALWPNSSFARNILGTNTSIRSITKDDLDAFASMYYQASNAIFVVVSDDDPEDIADTINATMLPTGERPNVQKEIFAEDPLPMTRESVDSDQSTVCFQWRTSPDERNSYVIFDFIRDYLGNTWTSRLNQKLRIEKSLTYWTYGDSAEFLDTGYLRFTCSVKSVDVEEVISLASKEFADLRDREISTQEIKDHQTSFISNFVRNNTTAGDLMNYYGYLATVGEGLISLDDYIKKIQAIAPGEVREIASSFLAKEKMSVVVIGV